MPSEKHDSETICTFEEFKLTSDVNLLEDRLLNLAAEADALEDKVKELESIAELARDLVWTLRDQAINFEAKEQLSSLCLAIEDNEPAAADNGVAYVSYPLPLLNYV